MSVHKNISFSPDVDICSSNPCENDGICNVNHSTNYLCSCKSGYFGTHCESKFKFPYFRLKNYRLYFLITLCKVLYARDGELLRKCYMCTDNVKSMLFNTVCSLCTFSNVGGTMLFTVFINCTSATTIYSDNYFDYQGIAVLQAYFPKDCKALIRNLVYKFMKRLDNSQHLLS